ncbi:hypothetical protein PF008_g31443, partial [Phytophthora fragariae]
MWSTPNFSLCVSPCHLQTQHHEQSQLSGVPASEELVLAIVASSHLFQAPNIIRCPIAVLAIFYLAPAHLYQPAKVIRSPAAVVFLLLLNFFSLRTIVAASKQRQFASVSPPLNIL